MKSFVDGSPRAVHVVAAPSKLCDHRSIDRKMKRELAKILASARQRSRRVDEAFVDKFNAEVAKFGDENPEAKLNFAYDVLDEYEEEMHANNWKTIGYKVGATSAIARGKLKLREPFYGPLLVPGPSIVSTAPSSLARKSSSSSVATILTSSSAPGSHNLSPSRSFAEETPIRFSLSKNNVRGVEAEFAFRACRDVTPTTSPSYYTVEELTSNYFDVVYPIVEVCGSRLPVSRAATADGPLLVADGAGNEAMAEHPRARFARPSGSVLDQERAQVKIDGKLVASGYGEDVLGSPSKSLAWFVERFVQGGGGGGGRRRTIPKNAIVSTGAICGLIPITKPCYVTVEFLHWGDIHLAFRE